jgi:predicted metal-binding membrane protein
MQHTSMASMLMMPMPGGCTTSMIWMRMPGQTWGEVVMGFVAMWCAMTAAMMLPCLLPMLWRYRRAIRGSAEPALEPGCLRLHSLTARVALGYFGVYLLLGLCVLALGLTLAALVRLQPAVARLLPVLTGLVILVAGLNQFTRSKLQQLRQCRRALPTLLGSHDSSSSAWQHGLRLGVLCAHCCAGLMIILLVLGMMELRWMVPITAAITLERLGPAGEQVARASGVIAVTLGLLVLSRAVAQI